MGDGVRESQSLQCPTLSILSGRADKGERKLKGKKGVIRVKMYIHTAFSKGK